MSIPLSKYFVAAGAKRLSQVEVSKYISNQHEFNGVNGFKDIFGTERATFDSKFLYLTDDEDAQIAEDGKLTWYDARENHPKRSEFRLYYSENSAIEKAQEGDLVIISKSTNNIVLVIVCPQGSTHESQLLWLFGLEETQNNFIFKDFSSEKSDLGYAGNLIISSLGLEIENDKDEELYLLKLMQSKFGNDLPSTAIFSAFARETLITKVCPIEEPDETLLSWMEWEEKLFRTFEKHHVQLKLREGFGVDGLDVDEFIKFSLSVQNKRKSRAGYAFENHLAMIFDANSVKYTKGAKTERNNKPDFLFPCIEDYKNPQFPTQFLSVLGLKTTAKDRWRQVLSEADRIETKHLITLEPAISKNQTDEMKIQKVQLIIPKKITTTYSRHQLSEIIILSDFIRNLKSKASHGSTI